MSGLAPAAWNRLLSLALGCGSGALLLTAARLEPAAEGFGTHKQLGLSDCTLLTWTGQPCPTCGMTTSWAYAAHGRVFEALAAQPFGLLLFLGALAVVGVAVAETIRPTGRWQDLLARTERWDRAIAAFLLAGLLLGWVYKIAVWPES